MRIVTKMYDILGLLEQAAAEVDVAKRSKLYEEAKATLTNGERKVKGRAVYQAVFGTYSDNEETDQMRETCVRLIERGSITSHSGQIFSMEFGDGDKMPFGETIFFKENFGDGDIDQSKVDAFKAEIGSAELALCKIGADFCSRYQYGEDYLFFWDRILADLDQTLVKSLYLSNGALRSLGEYRANSRQFTYLSHDLRGLNDGQLAEIKVRSGEIDPNQVAHWLYGEQQLSPDATEFLTTAVQMACNSGRHNCWSELLHLEFGQNETTADKILGGTAFDYPLDSLQEKLRSALHAVNSHFLKLRANTKRNHNHEPGDVKRPYEV